MLRMEIALFLVVTLVAYMYFSTEKENSALHRSCLMIFFTGFFWAVWWL